MCTDYLCAYIKLRKDFKTRGFKTLENMQMLKKSREFDVQHVYHLSKEKINFNSSAVFNADPAGLKTHKMIIELTEI